MFWSLLSLLVTNFLCSQILYTIYWNTRKFTLTYFHSNVPSLRPWFLCTSSSTDTHCVACIRRYCIGPCQVQQRRRSRAQLQHEGGSRVDSPTESLIPQPIIPEPLILEPIIPEPWSCWQCVCTLSPFPRKQMIRKPVVWTSPTIRASWARPPPALF